MRRAAILILLGVATPVSATDFIAGTVDARATVNLPSGIVTDTTGPQALTAIGMAAAAGDARTSLGPAFAAARHAVVANWASAEAGTARFDWDWTFNSGGRNQPSPRGTNTAFSLWRYAFTATHDGRFLGTIATSAFSSGPPAMATLRGEDDLWPWVDIAVTTPGRLSFMVPLVAGQSYVMTLRATGDIWDGRGFSYGGGRSALHWGVFAGVPEPANWAMLITGFGLVGGVARRRRHSDCPSLSGGGRQKQRR